jgi:hypothetical protein
MGKMGFRSDTFLRVLATMVLLGPTVRAQPPAKPSAEASAKPAAKPYTKVSTPDPGSVSDGVYHNTFFGFSYKIPFGWVERTSEMQEGSEPGKSLLLLSIFERPPEATGETVNSAVVIAAESVASYPGLKKAADYFGPLSELTTSQGFKAVNQPYDFSVGAKPLARGDFSKDLGTLTMDQASLVMLEKGYVVSFTVIGGDEDEVDQLIDGLSFGSGAKASKRRPAPQPQ